MQEINGEKWYSARTACMPEWSFPTSYKAYYKHVSVIFKKYRTKKTGHLIGVRLKLSNLHISY